MIAFFTSCWYYSTISCGVPLIYQNPRWLSRNHFSNVIVWYCELIHLTVTNYEAYPFSAETQLVWNNQGRLESFKDVFLLKS